MSLDERVNAVAEFGFTERQARFLVTVMLHAGVCVPRQYSRFAGTAYGHKVSAFFDKLVQRGFATATGCLHNRAQLYHVRHQALYRAIGEPESRYRRPVSARQAIERLMRLDGIVANPELIWLSGEDEKVAFFHLIAPSLPPERLPHSVVGNGSSARVRLFSDDVPIGVTTTGRVVFLSLILIPLREDFCAIVQRYSDLFRALPGWTLRLLVPRDRADWLSTFEADAREELTRHVPADLMRELTWYFQQRRDTPDVRLTREKRETSGDRIDHAVSDVDAAALGCDEVPDLVQVGFSLRCDAEVHQCDALRSAASRVRPRCLTSSASAFMDSSVVDRPSPRASEASASSSDARISSRLRSRSSHSASASCTASSSWLKRPLSMARFTSARWSGVRSTFIRSR